MKWRNSEPERGAPPLCEKCGERHYGRSHPFRALRKDRGEAGVSDPATQGSAAATRRRALAAERRFTRQLEQEGWPDYGIRCKHGMQGGLICEWCGDPDKLPADQKLRGVPRGR